MTREELIDMICPIEETNECGRGANTSNCTKCWHILHDMLVDYEYQIRAEAYEKGRADGRIESFKSGYMNGIAYAIDECIQIVEYYTDAWDGIFMAIQELHELKENYND